MDKQELVIRLDGADTELKMDIDRIDNDLFLFGFEEHVHTGMFTKINKTEQVLSKKHLKQMRTMLDEVIGDDYE